jgi:hypothetical protein
MILKKKKEKTNRFISAVTFAPDAFVQSRYLIELAELSVQALRYSFDGDGFVSNFCPVRRIELDYL